MGAAMENSDKSADCQTNAVSCSCGVPQWQEIRELTKIATAAFAFSQARARARSTQHAREETVERRGTV